MICPLCHHPESSLFDQDKFRTYYRCEACTVVYVPHEYFLKSNEEKGRYDAHQNNDSSYEAYLSQIALNIFAHVSTEQQGLDFGCGATTLMQMIFARKSIKLDSYDLYFFPNEKIWEGTYDFIIMSEVIEHLRNPLETMEKLAACLKPKGQIFIKTKFYPENKQKFHEWFYKRDLTHIIFFNDMSLNRFASRLGFKKLKSLNLPDLYQLIKEEK